MTNEELKTILENTDWTTLNLVIMDKYDCLLIPRKKWDSVSDALHDKVGDEGWKEEWDY